MKLIISITALLIINLYVYSLDPVSFSYRGNYYTLTPIIGSDLSLLNPYNPLREVDRSQTHRILLSTLEKSRLTSLNFVGEVYEFNNISIRRLINGVFEIKDINSGYKAQFSIGNYDSIQIHTVTRHINNTEDTIDKLATLFMVKKLLVIMTAGVEAEVLPVQEQTDDFLLKQEHYRRFLEPLKNRPRSSIPQFLFTFISINITVTLSSSINSDWTNPIDLYYEKKGDYKSVAFFYYYTLKQLGFDTVAYLVTPLTLRNDEQLLDLYRKSRTAPNEIEGLYARINPDNNVTRIISNNRRGNVVFPQIYYYNPPVFNNSTLIVTVKTDDRWIYSTGGRWIDNGILSQERVCADYSPDGCYYSRVRNDNDIFNNVTLRERDYSWDIFYP